MLKRLGLVRSGEVGGVGRGVMKNQFKFVKTRGESKQLDIFSTTTR